MRRVLVERVAMAAVHICQSAGGAVSSAVWLQGRELIYIL
jgi:hypothetical protein